MTSNESGQKTERHHSRRIAQHELSLIISRLNRLLRRIESPELKHIPRPYKAQARIVDAVDLARDALRPSPWTSDAIDEAANAVSQSASILNNLLDKWAQGEVTVANFEIVSDEIESAVNAMVEAAFRLQEADYRQSRQHADDLKQLTAELRREYKNIQTLANDTRHRVQSTTAETTANLMATNARIEELSTGAKAQRDGFSQELIELRKEATKQIHLAENEFSEAMKRTREDESRSANEHLQAMRKLLRTSEATASAVADQEIADHYAEFAKKEEGAANNWRRTGIVIGLMIATVVVIIVIISIFRPIEGTFASILRILAPAIGGPVFIYATLESRQHRQKFWELRDAEILHKTLDSVIASLPDEEAVKVRVAALENIYIKQKWAVSGHSSKSHATSTSKASSSS